MAEPREKLEKSKIKTLGEKEQKGKYFFRHNVLENDVEGEHWSEKEETIDAHEQFFKDGTEIEYQWVKGAEGKAAKLRIYPVKAEGEKEDSGKRPSAYSQETKKKDKYWDDKFEIEKVWKEHQQNREAFNDKKLEFQSIRNCLAPFYLAAAESGVMTIDKAIDALEAKTTEIYNRHNPTAKIADVSK